MNDPTQVVMILFVTVAIFQIVFNYILVCCSLYGSYLFAQMCLTSDQQRSIGRLGMEGVRSIHPLYRLCFDTR